MSDSFPHLFKPIRIGTRESRNRVMRLATQTNTGENGVATERSVALYQHLARGGAGVIVTESMRVHASNTGSAHTMQLYLKQSVPSLQKLTQAVRAEGALLIVQLNHGGRQHHSNTLPTLWGPSAIACPQSGGVPHQVTRAEIAELVAGYATAALHAKLAGADGVEVHGAQGHLVQQFVSEFSNQRTDEYGGSLENRLRFVREILASVRDKVGADFIVGYRMGIEEFTPGGITVSESKVAAEQLVKLGIIDYLSLTQGNFNTIETHCPDSHYPPHPYVDIQAEIKAVTPGVPVAASTRIQTPAQAEAILAAGKADIIGMARALVADPEWPNKARRGATNEIRRCIACSYCWGGIVNGKRLACSVNANAGFESEFAPLARHDSPKRVVVVGGGPGGMETARVLTERGHRVTLFEKSATLGGKLNLARLHLPYHEAGNAIDYLVGRMSALGVDVRVSTNGTLGAVLSERPDAVVVATGAQAFAPKVAGDGSVPVVTSGTSPAGSTVVVVDEDGYYWPSCVTEELARRGCKVVYVTRFHEALRELPEISRNSTLRALDELGVVLRPTMFVDRIEKGAVILRHYYNSHREERIGHAAEVVWIGPQRANDRLVQELRDAGIADVRLVGDAYTPRRLANAIAEGHRAGRAL